MASGKPLDSKCIYGIGEFHGSLSEFNFVVIDIYWISWVNKLISLLSYWSLLWSRQLVQLKGISSIDVYLLSNWDYVKIIVVSHDFWLGVLYLVMILTCYIAYINL